MKEKFNKFIQIFVAGFVFLLPLVIVPLFTDIHDYGKQFFGLAGVILIFVLWTIKSLLEKKVSFTKSKFGLTLVILFLISLVSTLINTPNKIQSMLAMAGAATLFICLLTYLYIKNLSKLEIVVIGLVGASAIMALVTVVLSTGLIKLPLNFPSLNLSITENFSLMGSMLSQTIWLACTVPLGMALAYESLVHKKNIKAIVFFILSTLILAGIGLGINALTSTAKPVVLSKAISWSIAMESLKTTKQAFFGVGPGQYLNAFTAFKPISHNATPYWDLRFGFTSWLFQVLTELGILGLLFYILLGWKIVKNLISVIRQKTPSAMALALAISLVILFGYQFYLPINFSLMALFFILIALLESVLTKEEEKSFDLSPLGSTVYLFLIFPVLFWAGIVYFGGKTALANHYYLQSLKATVANDGTKAYDLQIKTISIDPNLPLYRSAYANTNFALANALASQENLTDNDRNTISQLIQQAIREAKSAVSLDPNSASGWENLASLYRNLINFAEGSDQWAIASYQEAIKLDPLNPLLRIELGGLYFSQKNYNLAANLFNQSVSLKPDFANAHYNLANSLVALGALQDAKIEYENTLSLVKIGSDDYQKVSAELEEVKKNLPSPTPAEQLQPETLSTPQQPNEGIEPPLELPQEAAPNPVVTEAPAETPADQPPVEEVQPSVQPEQP